METLVETMKTKKNVKQHEAWMAGDIAHQGDIIFVALKKLPKNATVRKNRQIFEGNTSGSRHVVIGGTVYTVPNDILSKLLKEEHNITIDEKYIGPVFSGACVVEHPEHMHQEFPDHCATVVLFQRNLDAEEREIKARD